MLSSPRECINLNFSHTSSSRRPSATPFTCRGVAHWIIISVSHSTFCTWRLLELINLPFTVATVKFTLWITCWDLWDYFSSVNSHTLTGLSGKPELWSDTYDAWNQNVHGTICFTSFSPFNQHILGKSVKEYMTSICWHSLCLPKSFSVLTIHKRPATTSSNFTFPVNGWRGMLDWVRTSEEKISVSRDALSIEQSGEIKEKIF